MTAPYSLSRRAWRVLAAFGAALAAYVLIGCLVETKEAGRRGSEVENEVYGVLVSRNGTAVAGARVKAVDASLPVGNLDDSGAVITDAEGRYAFPGLPAGTYNILGDYRDGELVVLIPGVVHADTLAPDSVGTDTLRAPGRIRGRLLLGTEGFGGAIAYIPGTSYLAFSDDSGRFLMTGVPQGRYAVKYTAPGFLVEPDTGVFVPSAATVELPAKFLAHDPAAPPPPPRGLSAVFDTLAGSTRLAWEGVEVSDLDGYLVYRDVPGQAEPQLVSKGVIRATVFTDTGLGDGAAIAEGALVYRVKARDREANASLRFSEPLAVPAAPRSRVLTVLEWIAPRAGIDTVPLGEPLTLAAAFSNPTRGLARARWILGDDSLPVRERAPAGRDGRDTLVLGGLTAGRMRVRLLVEDDAGTAGQLARAFIVEANRLRAVAGPDTSVSLGDSVALSAAQASRFGRVVSWAWDIGMQGRFRPAAPGEFRIQVPARPGPFPCVLRVVDAFGDTAYDTAQVRIVGDPPKVDAIGDTTVSIGDTVRVEGKATDAFGRVVRWQWKPGAAGKYREAGPEARFPVPGVPEPRYPIVLRATDDDGEWAEDTVWVEVSADIPKAEAYGDTSVSLGDSVRARGAATDGYGRIVRWEWRVGPDGAFKDAGPAPLLAMPAVPAAGFPIILRVTDDDGQTALDTIRVDVLADPPFARAMGDTTVSIGDSVRVRSSASDRFGAVASLEWQPGAAGPYRELGPSPVIAVPPLADPKYPIVLRVTDDDGQVASDTLFVNVVQDLPKASATRQPAGTVSVRDSVSLEAQGSDGFDEPAFAWACGEGAAFEKAARGPWSAKAPAAPVPRWPCVLRVSDGDGQAALDTVWFEVVLDLPFAKVAAAPLLGRPGDSIRLSSAGSGDGIGRLVSREWAIGGSGFRKAGPDTIIVLPAALGPLRCVLRVTDEDGLTALDSVLVNVLPPVKVDAGADTALEAGKTLALRPKALPGYSPVVRWSWDIGGTGTFRTVSAGDTAVILPLRDTSFLCVVKGESPEGLWGVDTIRISVLKILYFNWEFLPLPASMGTFSNTVPIGFNGKLWLLGGLSGIPRANIYMTENGSDWQDKGQGPWGPRHLHAMAVWRDRLWITGGAHTEPFRDTDEHALNDVWSSADGVAWIKAEIQAPFTPRAGHAAFVLGGKLCVMGGWDGNRDTARIARTDLWCTEDSRTWTRVANPVRPLESGIARPYAQLGDGSLFLADSIYTWESPDGINWEKRFYGTSRVLGETSLFAFGREILSMGNDPVWGVEMRRLDRATNTVQEGLYNFEQGARNQAYFFEFQGRPWIWFGSSYEPGKGYIAKACRLFP